jgi:hypothetical protein
MKKLYLLITDTIMKKLYLLITDTIMKKLYLLITDTLITDAINENVKLSDY